MKNTATSRDTGKLVFGLLRIGEMIDQRLNAALEPYELSVAKYGVLEALVRAGEPLPLGVLSERLGCVKSNVTQLVDRLEIDDLVRRMSDPQDRRTKLATITDLGRQRHEVGRQALEAAQGELLEGVSEGERQLLGGLMSRFG